MQRVYKMTITDPKKPDELPLVQNFDHWIVMKSAADALVAAGFEVEYPDHGYTVHRTCRSAIDAAMSYLRPGEAYRRAVEEEKERTDAEVVVVDDGTEASDKMMSEAGDLKEAIYGFKK